MFTPVAFDGIATSRAHAVAELSQMLDVRPPPGLTLVFYPDAGSKTADTHHVGTGMAKGVTLAEIFNDSVRLDPYHEIAHAVAAQLGWAPAWLSEGFAIHATERLGEDALAQLGPPGRTADQAACGFQRAGELLPTAELLRLDDIGPTESRPHVTYPQAASFLGFLVDSFGLPALRQAYASLSPAHTEEENDAAFVRAFGVTVDAADRLWRARLAAACD
jgi:hypothetical protein